MLTTSQYDPDDAAGPSSAIAPLVPPRNLLPAWQQDAQAASEMRLSGKPRGPVTGFKRLDAAIGGAFAPGVHIVHGSPGSGKCLGRDTPVLMFDGTVKMAQDVRVGDRLMGPDSTPRTVLSTAAGFDNLYRVVPVKGDPYVVNEPHILSLKLSGSGKIVDIPVEDYLRTPDWYRARLKGFRVAIDFHTQPVPLDPYFLGLWLGDGDSGGPDITNPEPEIEAFLREYAERIGLTMSRVVEPSGCPMMRIRGPGGGKPNPVLDALRELDLIGNKHVPLIYRVNGRDERLQLLAGIIDTDGYIQNGCCDIAFKRKQLADDVAYLARSLGLAAYVAACTKTCTNTGATGTYYRMSLSGDLSIIPVRVPRRKAQPRRQQKDVLVTGISVEPVGTGEYFGFTIDGDRRFLLGDFTVTHNTAFALQVAAQCQFPCLYLTSEMSPLELMRRVTCRVTGVYLGRLKSGELTTAESVRFAQDAVSATPMLAFLDATRHYASPGWIIEAAQTLRGEHRSALVVVDSIHAWTQGAETGAAEYDAVTAGIRSLQQVAARLNVPVLGIAERNRGSMSRGGMSAGAGSRKLEYGSESVIELDRKEDQWTAAMEVEIRVTLSKNRHGVVGRQAPLMFNGALQRFREVDPQGEAR